jgi:hypothetical protein
MSKILYIDDQKELSSRLDILLKGRAPGKWLAIKPDYSEVVAEADTLEEAASISVTRGVPEPIFMKTREKDSSPYLLV